MPTLLIRHADCVATFDDPDPSQASELRQASVFIRDHRIEAIGPAAELPTTADEVIDARGHLVLPGLVNTHHHMYQSLTRAIPQAQNAELFGWLRALYPIWVGPLACLTGFVSHTQTLNGLRITSEVALGDLGTLRLSPSCMSSLYKTALSLRAPAATMLASYTDKL